MQNRQKRIHFLTKEGWDLGSEGKIQERRRDWAELAMEELSPDQGFQWRIQSLSRSMDKLEQELLCLYS